MNALLERLDAELRTAALEWRIGVEEADRNHVRTLRHEDGSVTLIMWDEDGEYANPRNNDGNVATLIQTNSRCSDIDDDDAGLGEARERFDDAMMRRYLTMFRPDIAYYADYWSAGDSYGWGYVTRDAMREAGLSANPVDAQEAFDQEVSLYRQWAEGEVYGAIHLTVGAPVVRYGAEGAYVDGYDVEEDSCWGFLGYDDLADIATQFTDSPVVTS